MAQARSFREGWLTSMKIDALGNDSAELFLFRLALRADKNGVYHGEPELLRAAAYPLQISRRRLADVTRFRDMCARAGLLRLWTAGNGRPYVQILNFRQKTPSEKPLYPLPPGEPDDTGQESLSLAEQPPPPPDEVNRSKENCPLPPPPAGERERPPSFRDRLFQTLCELEGVDLAMVTAACRRRISSALRDIENVKADLIPADLQQAYSAYRREFPTAAFTASALAKYWPRLMGATKQAAGKPVPALIEDEPPGWRDWINENTPDAPYARGGEKEHAEWSELAGAYRRYLIDQCRKRDDSAHGRAA